MKSTPPRDLRTRIYPIRNPRKSVFSERTLNRTHKRIPSRRFDLITRIRNPIQNVL
ncbi:MAG: hypothetical protein R3B67_09640 [Phycisphaerales bacterium]